MNSNKRRKYAKLSFDPQADTSQQQDVDQPQSSSLFTSPTAPSITTTTTTTTSLSHNDYDNDCDDDHGAVPEVPPPTPYRSKSADGGSSASTVSSTSTTMTGTTPRGGAGTDQSTSSTWLVDKPGHVPLSVFHYDDFDNDDIGRLGAPSDVWRLETQEDEHKGGLEPGPPADGGGKLPEDDEEAEAEAAASAGDDGLLVDMRPTADGGGVEMCKLASSGAEDEQGQEGKGAGGATGETTPLLGRSAGAGAGAAAAGHRHHRGKQHPRHSVHGGHHRHGEQAAARPGSHGTNGHHSGTKGDSAGASASTILTKQGASASVSVLRNSAASPVLSSVQSASELKRALSPKTPDALEAAKTRRRTQKWGVPSTDQIATLTTTAICNVVCMIAGMSFCYSNVLISLCAPIVAAIIFVYTKNYGPRNRATVVYIIIVLAVVCSICGVVGFTSGFWLWPDIQASIVEWAKYVLPATYPFFIAFTVMSTAVLTKLRRSARAARDAAFKHVIDDTPSATLYAKITKQGRVANTTAVDATIVTFVNPPSKPVGEEDWRGVDFGPLRIDPRSVAASLDPNELSRVEANQDHTAMILKFPQVHLHDTQSNLHFGVYSVGLFLFESKLLIVMHDSIPLFEPDFFKSVSNFSDIVVRLWHRSVSMFETQLKSISARTTQLEDNLEQSSDNNKLVQLFALEKSLAFFVSALASTNRALLRMCNSEFPKPNLHLTTDHIALLEDLQIETEQCYQTARITAQVVYGLTDARASITANNLNAMMKNLNAIVISIAIPTFLASVGGMSEFTAMVGADRWPYAFPMFIVVMFFVGVLTFIGIKKIEPLLR
ncbi:divalent metal ion transporter [Pelomyxa schiedti]|nr:divalent metal ion transporter [Pelomyxa schiedti]